MRIPLNTDLAVAVFGLVFSATLWFGSALPGRLSLMFPRAVLVILCVLSVALAVKAFWRPSEREVVIEGSVARLLGMIGVLFVWWMGIRTIGFITTTLVIFTLLAAYLAYVQDQFAWRKLALWIPIIVALVGGFYLVFSRILNVVPPAGLLI